jgi:hypothetical protein
VTVTIRNGQFFRGLFPKVTHSLLIDLDRILAAVLTPDLEDVVKKLPVELDEVREAQQKGEEEVGTLAPQLSCSLPRRKVIDARRVLRSFEADGPRRCSVPTLAEELCQGTG